MLLAHLPSALREGLLARPLARFTPHTATGAASLRAELEAVLDQGYAVAVEELEVGLAAVAAPCSPTTERSSARSARRVPCTG